MQFPITIGLHRSHFLDAVLLLVASCAIGVSLVIRQSIALHAALVIAICLLYGLAWWQLAPKFSAIRLERSGQIFIRDNSENDFVATQLLPGATVHPWLTVTRLKTDDERCHTLIVAVGSINRQDFRRLRVFLRWQADFNVADDDA